MLTNGSLCSHSGGMLTWFVYAFPYIHVPSSSSRTKVLGRLKIFFEIVELENDLNYGKYYLLIGFIGWFIFLTR